MSNFVFVIDNQKQPCSPVHPAAARKLLSEGKAAVFRLAPFTLILKEECREAVKPLEVKIDPGSKTTGFALVQEDKVIFGMELAHRGDQIKARLLQRSMARRNRRHRKTRYRPSRFLNRASARAEGRLPPSLMHRVLTVLTWVKRFIRWSPVSGIAMELVKFDAQKMADPEITGVEYQQGELAGYEVREYLLEKWGRKCSYCGKENVPLQVEHIHPKSKGGPDRVSNLCLACEPCNTKKGDKPVEEFLKKKPEVLARIKAQAKVSLKDAAVVNATRWRLFNELNGLSLPVRTGSGAKTKHNRVRLGLEKAHWLDAACVGEVEGLAVAVKTPLLIKCKGQGSRQLAMLDKYGYPRQYRQCKPIHGYRNGDLVVADIPSGKNQGRHIGVACPRERKVFVVTTKTGKLEVHMKHLRRVACFDGYERQDGLCGPECAVAYRASNTKKGQIQANEDTKTTAG